MSRHQGIRHGIRQGMALAFAAAWATGCVVIEDGEVGVSKSFGKISDEPVGQGVHIVVPVVRQIETWDVKLQTMTETATVPSSEGLIVGLDTSLLYKVEPQKAPQLRKTVGRDYVDRLIIPYFRNSVRDVVSGYQVKNIYAEVGRKEIARKIQEFLEENLDPQGVAVEAVLLRDVKLPQGFKDAIEAKLTAEQKVAAKEFERQQAMKDAEIEVERAKGAAEAQRIVRSTLSDSYLQYLWIKTLNENPNVIYVATEANMPIFKSIGSGP